MVLLFVKYGFILSVVIGMLTLNVILTKRNKRMEQEKLLAESKKIAENINKWRSTDIFQQVIRHSINDIKQSIEELKCSVTMVDSLPDQQKNTSSGHCFAVSIDQNKISLYSAIRYYGEIPFSNFDEWQFRNIKLSKEFNLNEYKSLSNEQQEAFITAIEADMKFMVPPNTEIIRHNKYTLVFILEKHRIYKEKESLV